MKRWWLIISLPLLALAAVGCKTQKEYQSHVEYAKVYQLDSVFVDCTDTLYVVERGDTVRIFETKTVKEYHYTVYRDTLRQCDTVTVEVRTGAAADNPKPVSRWKWFLFGALSAIFIIFALRIIIKIYLKK